MKARTMLLCPVGLLLSACGRASDVTYGSGDVITGDVVLDPAPGETAMFTAVGTVTMPATAEARADWPFQFRAAGGDTPVWGYCAARGPQMAVGSFADATARFTRRADGSTVTDFDAGTFDFATCGGEATQGYVDFLRTQQPSSALVVHAGASVFFPAFNFVGYTAKDGYAEIDVDGGLIETRGRFLWCPGQIGNGIPRRNAVRVRNGGRFVVAAPGTYASNASQIGFDYVAKTDFVLDVSGAGSVFDAHATCISTGCRGSRCLYRASDGGTLRFGEFESTKGAGGETRIVVCAGGALESTGDFRMGRDGYGSTYDGATSVLAVTNGTVSLKKLALDSGSRLLAKDSVLTFGTLWLRELSRGLDLDGVRLAITDEWRVDGKSRPVWGFTNQTIAVGKAQFGWDGSNPTVVFSDSDVEVSGSAVIGHWKGDGKVVVDGASRFRLGESAGLSLGGAGAGTGRCDVVSGEVSVSAAPNAYVTLGVADGSFGQLNVLGGSVVSDCARTAGNGVCVGGSGDGNAEMNVSGGLVRLPCVLLGMYSGAGDPARRGVLNVSGGLVDCRALNVAQAAKTFGDVRLTGGEVRVGSLAGGSGTSSLVADGGVLSTADDVIGQGWTARWISNLTSARVGARGLVLDVRHPVASDQPFGDADGASGRGLLVKAGTAALTQTGALLNGVTAVAGGELVYSATEAGRLVVTNGASLRLVGDTDKSFAGLTVGGDGTEGFVTLELGRTVTLASEPSLSAARVSVSGTMAAGTHVLFRQTGVASDEAREAWTALTLFGGQSEGFDTAFSTSAEDGETSFLLVVTESRPLDDGDFCTPVGASGVRLWSGRPVGDNAYRFSSGTYAKVEATASAEVTGDLTLAGWTEVSVPAGETLTLSGTLTGGGIRKTGDGTLVVSGPSNRLGLGVKVAGGVARFRDAASMGLALGTGAVLELQRGELDLGTASGSLPAALRFANVKGEAVRIGGAGDLACPDYRLGQGTIVKVGAGRICLRATADLATPEPADPLVVADGEFAFEQGLGVRVCICRDVHVGTNGIPCTVQPRLTAAGGVLSLGSDIDNTARTFYLGVNEHADAAIRTLVSPGLFFTNTFVCANSFKVGTASGGVGRDLSPEIAFVESKLCAFWSMELSSRAGVATRFRATGSRLGITDDGGLSVNGSVDAEIDRSTVGTAYGFYDVLLDAGVNTMGRLDGFSFGPQASGRFVLKNGTDFRVAAARRVGNGVSGTVTFVVDGASWRMERGRRTGSGYEWLDEDETFLFSGTSHMELSAGEGGLVVDPRTDHAVTVAQPLSGPGGFVKRGAGSTLRFVTAREVSPGGAVTNDADRAETLCTTGLNAIEAGTVELAAKAAAAGVRIAVGAAGALDLQGTAHQVTVSGAGTVRNGTLGHGARLLVDVASGSPLTLEGVTLNGAAVDVGETAFAKPYPVGVRVAKLGAGSTFRRLKFKGVDADGHAVSGRFAVDADGFVVMDIGAADGTLLIVR